MLGLANRGILTNSKFKEAILDIAWLTLDLRYNFSFKISWSKSGKSLIKSTEIPFFEPWWISYGEPTRQQYLIVETRSHWQKLSFKTINIIPYAQDFHSTFWEEWSNFE